MELASKYNPADVEGKWYQYWLDNKLFSSKPDGREPYTIVIRTEKFVVQPILIPFSLHFGGIVLAC